MALLKIARIGHPMLWQKAQPVPDPGAPEIRRLVADMIETMMDAPGVGLAAPQVYVSLRLFVFYLPEARTGEPSVPPQPVINPSLDLLGLPTMQCEEGCLSIPGMRAIVPRHARIRYSGVDCDGRVIGGEAEGFHANVVQHEIDHLDGILYPMRITDFSGFGFVEELTRARRQGTRHE